MLYTVQGTDINNYPKSSIICIFTQFILKNPDYFSILCDVLLSTNKFDRETRKRYISERIQELLDLEFISKDTIPEFEDIFSKFLLKADIDDNYRGKIIEHIIAYIGPFSFEDDNINSKMECVVLDGSGNIVGGAKNFDVGFLAKCTCFSELSVELLEAKVNSDNFFYGGPGSRTNLNMCRRGTNKATYMETIRVILKKSKHSMVALATPQRDVSFSKALLGKNGFHEIEILNFEILDNRLYAAHAKLVEANALSKALKLSTLLKKIK